jgi:putative photosynthetic complex assembly protein
MTDVTRFSTLSKEMKHRDREMVPKFLVQAMFALMFGAMALVAFDQITGRPLLAVAPDSAIVKERAIWLDGTRNSGVIVRDENGNRIGYSGENKAGFIDVIWMSVNRERTVQDVPSDAPLRLVRRENGRVAVIDDTTGWKIELIGYGVDNVAAFARLID